MYTYIYTSRPELVRKFLKMSEKPNFIEKVSKFTGSLARHIANGMAGVPDDILAHRLEMCRTCPLLVENQCSLCGCFVEIKTKWASEECPHTPKKWTAYKTGDEVPKPACIPCQAKTK